MFVADRGSPLPAPEERALDFMVRHGFDFVRLPTDYRAWTDGFDYFQPDERIFEHLDGYLAVIVERDLHVSLNLHRAPGYCVNRNDLERDNLWTDAIAQDAFVFLWETFARRYRSIPSRHLSFDLLNEPPEIHQYGMTRDNHAALIRRTVAAIRAIDPEREIVIDGLGGGHVAMPELADLDVVHSGRGYQPMPISHFRAPWWAGSEGLPPPRYPGTPWEGRLWDQTTLREFYAPWRAVEATGVRVHIGEFGCYERTPNDIALAWFQDLFGLFREYGWGYALWNFAGPFGIAGHRRPGARFARVDGFDVDIELLALMKDSRIT